MLWWAACSNFPAAAIAPATSFASWTPRCSAVSSARHQESQGVCQRSPASAEPLCRCALVGSSPALHKDVQVPRTGAPGILPPAPLVHPCISQDAQERPGLEPPYAKCSRVKVGRFRQLLHALLYLRHRSDERRVGKEVVS